MNLSRRKFLLTTLKGLALAPFAGLALTKAAGAVVPPFESFVAADRLMTANELAMTAGHFQDLHVDAAARELARQIDEDLYNMYLKAGGGWSSRDYGAKIGICKDTVKIRRVPKLEVYR